MLRCGFSRAKWHFGQGERFVLSRCQLGVFSSAVDDSACVYHWASLSCKPEASCSIQYHFGDVTPSDACRVSTTSDSTRIPQQFHLAFAGKEAGTGMAISWTTFALEEDPAVWMGATEGKLTQVKDATIETKSYYKDDHYELYSYHAVVEGLKPNKEYFYKVGSASKTKFQSAVSSFTTARKSGDKSPFTIAVYGDMGADANAVETNKYVNTLVDKVDFVYHLGDVSYADDAFLSAKTAFGFFYEQVYNKFMNSMTNIMRRMAYMVLVGNHEAECHSPACLLSDKKLNQLGNYSAFNARFRMPSPESGDDATYTNPKAPVYVISGSAGGPEGLTKYKNPQSPKWHVLMDNKHYAMTMMSVTPTNMTLTTVDSATGAVCDKFSIIKEHGDASQKE
ncbi:Metallo-dependent phosphatase-like [Phytophthora cactorum]|nr:Metallo-dependent phosphatase-like [Phytophthora cactorum]